MIFVIIWWCWIQLLKQHIRYVIAIIVVDHDVGCCENDEIGEKRFYLY